MNKKLSAGQPKTRGVFRVRLKVSITLSAALCSWEVDGGMTRVWLMGAVEPVAEQAHGKQCWEGARPTPTVLVQIAFLEALQGQLAHQLALAQFPHWALRGARRKIVAVTVAAAMADAALEPSHPQDRFKL
jgi:hypothetical protein